MVLAKYSPFPADSLCIVKVLAAAMRTRAGTLKTRSKFAGVAAVVGWTIRSARQIWAAAPTARRASWVAIVLAALVTTEAAAQRGILEAAALIAGSAKHSPYPVVSFSIVKVLAAV